MLAQSAIKSAKTTSDGAFSVTMPALWNTLPPSLRAVDNINTFKRGLKARLFKQGYFS